MPEPQIYNAAEVALAAQMAATRDYVPPEERIEERDPVWNFEQIPAALQETTDLRAWMHKAPVARTEIVKKWSRELSKKDGEDPIALAIRRKKVRRRLLFVVVTESEAQGGSRDVAAEAFRALFPKE